MSKDDDQLMKLWKDVEVSKSILMQLDKTVQDYDNKKQQRRQASNTLNNSNSNFTKRPSNTSALLSTNSISSLLQNQRNKCRNTLPVELWGAKFTSEQTRTKRIHQSTHFPINRSSSSSIIQDDFNILTGKEVTDKEMPRGKRIKPILN
jgi:hypothetical protein